MDPKPVYLNDWSNSNGPISALECDWMKQSTLL